MLSSKIEINKSHCIRYNFSKTHCRYCEDICPVDAVRFGFPNRIEITHDICIKCGLCYAACPFGSIDISKDDEFILSNIEQAEKIEVGCIFSFAKNRVACLSRLTDDLLFALLKDKSVVIKRGICKNCKFKSTLPYFYKNLKNAVSLLLSFGIEFRLTIKTYPDKSTFIPKESMDRRSLFNISRKFKPKKTKRELLLEKIKHEDIKHNRKFSDIGKLEISNECNLCGICEHICPMDAILVEKNDLKGLIKFNPALCVGCRECENACLPQAIKINKGSVSLFKTKPYVAFEAAKVICESCGKTFYTTSNEKICNICRHREDEKNRLIKFLKNI